ncbi:MAG TPA: hypothetical protein VFS05_00820 [Gemmatimonadaceae bacterium]|nr:hypothetical protein [Gemmatimonadaceae bacterium]
MTTPRPGRGAPDDPMRSHLVEVRRILLRLHKSLIDSERAEIERARGRMTSGAFLQMLINDEALAWLRPFSELIVQMDEALAADEPVAAADARAFIQSARALIAADGIAGLSVRYAVVHGRDAAVRAAHAALLDRAALALAE